MVYCLSYEHRIEDFDIAMLKKLLDQGYKTVIVLTHADDKNYDGKRKEYWDTLKTRLPGFQGRYAIVDVCAKSIVKLGQKTAAPVFGKENLFHQIEKDMFANFSKIFMVNLDAWKEDSLKKIAAFHRKQTENIERFYEFDPDSTVEKQAGEAARHIEDESEKLWKEIFDKAKCAIEEAQDVDRCINGSFARNFKFVLDWTILVHILPVIGQIIHFFTRKERMKNELKDALNKTVESLRREIDKVYRHAEAFADKLRKAVQ